MRSKRVLTVVLLFVITVSAIAGAYIISRPFILANQNQVTPGAAPEGSGQASLAPVSPVFNDDDEINEEPIEDKEFRGLWVASVINLDYPSKPGLTAATLKNETTRILNDAADMGFNAVILQVRPTGDAFYKSDIFPWSYYLTGNQGQSPDGGFDPLAFWVEEAHKRGLELHAWINPFRITRGTATSPKHDIASLAKTNPARLHPEWVVKHHDGSMYYNPGIPEVRKLIIDGVLEIIDKYDVDGIHYDDYFYPGADFKDDETFKKYGSGLSLADWRRDNVNKLIKETGEAIKQKNPDIRYGVSPFAIWKNKSTDPLGSDTNGSESYSAQYADTRTWVKSGWLDYICPQIYWEIGYAIADYEKLLHWWVDVIKDTGVDLYIGHASYRSGNQTAGNPWQGTAEIERQLYLNSTIPEVKGSVHFRYAFFADYKSLYEAVKRWHNRDEESGNQTPTMPQGLYIGRPETNISTSFDKLYILGASDPSERVYMNGMEITSRTPQGYFGVLVNLKTGVNTFTFTQGSKPETRVITRVSSSGGGTSLPTQSKAEIIAGSPYPNVYNEYRRPGEKITLSCKAPVGAKVTVTLDGKTYELKPAHTSAPGSSYIYTTTYSYVYTVPSVSAVGKAVNLGAPVYKMAYGGKTSSVTATGDVIILTDKTPYYAEVNKNEAYIYDSMTTTGGPSGILSKGQRDVITAVSSNGTWVRLGMGKWILRENVTRKMETSALDFSITGTSYDQSGKFHKISFSMKTIAASKVALDGNTLSFTIYNAVSVKDIKLPLGSLFSSVSVSTGNSGVTYTFTLAEGQSVNGYYTDVDGGTLNLYVAPKPKVSAGSRPLSGFTIMLDAGHGGSDTGALGPLGSRLSEKNLALSIAWKMKTELEKLGANVVMTRSGDTLVTLQQRLDLCREILPDMFISVHLNAMEFNVDCGGINGISVWYREKISKDFANSLFNHLIADLGTNQKGLHQANLFVCRPTWTPSAIIETGFISNPYDYEWLSDEAQQKRMSKSLAEWIVEYFS